MKLPRRSIVMALTAILIIAFVGWLVRSPWPGEVVHSAEFLSDTAGPYRIGETKEALLAAHFLEAVTPGANACSTGWVYLRSITEPQRQCLLNSESWEVEDGIAGLCPQHTDFFGTLSFESSKLTKVTVRCTRPE